MPESSRHRRYSHGHTHKNSHRQGKRDNGQNAAQIVWEWFWLCCYCNLHGAMSTTINLACPGCQHVRCEYCPMESVKTEGGRVVQRFSERFSMNSKSNPSTTSPPIAPPRKASPPMVSAPKTSWNDSIPPARTEPWSAPPDPVASFAALSLTSSMKPSLPAKSKAAIAHNAPDSYNWPTCNNIAEFDEEGMKAPSPEPRSSLESSSDWGTFSSASAKSNSSINHGSDTNDSDLSDSDGMEGSGVVFALDCHLASILNGRLDLAAFLLPEIHDRMDKEDVLPTYSSGLAIYIPMKSDDLEDNNSKGKQRVPTSGRRLPPSRSRGEESGDSQGCEEGGDRKRQRRGSGGSSEGTPGGNGARNSGSNRRGNFGKDPHRSPNRNPDDPGEDPGDEPAAADSLDIPNFACHFYKLDPGKYGIWTETRYDKCPGSRITELRRIKHHLQVAHRLPLPLPHCSRCFRSFQDNAALDEHSSALVPCEPVKRPCALQGGIDEGQWAQIEQVFRKKGQRRVDDISRWYEIWRILFPGVKEPSTTRTERPGYMAQSNYNLEQLMTEFERRVEKDIQRGVLKRDKQAQRYSHHFRETLDDLGACPGLRQLRSVGDDKEEESGSPSKSQGFSTDNDQMSSVDSEGSSARKRCVADLNPHDKGTLGDPREYIAHDSFFQSSALHVPYLSTSTQEYSISSQQRPDLPSSDWPTMNHYFEISPDVNAASQSTQPKLQCPQLFGLNGANALESTTAILLEADEDAIPVCDPTTIEPFDGEYMMSDDLLADFLQIENRKPEAMAPWNNKHSGNGFLDQF